MRLALQISGELRTLDFFYANVKKYILDPMGPENVDIFLHTWYRDSDEGEISGHGEGIALFKPRSYFIEKYEFLEVLHALPRSMTMFYSILRANQCRKEYEKILERSYDIVLRCRTDCLFSENPFLAIETFLKEKKPYLVIPKSKRIPNADGPSEDGSMICDWFAYGTPEMMDVYCETYTNWLNIGLFPVPESMLFLQLKMNGITEQTFLKRPILDFFLIEANGKIRGLDECVKQESKNS